MTEFVRCPPLFVSRSRATGVGLRARKGTSLAGVQLEKDKATRAASPTSMICSTGGADTGYGHARNTNTEKGGTMVGRLFPQYLSLRRASHLLIVQDIMSRVWMEGSGMEADEYM